MQQGPPKSFLTYIRARTHAVLTPVVRINSFFLCGRKTTTKAMLDHGVFMEGSTLKPNMVNPGRGCKSKFTAKEIGEATVTALRRVMPAAMPGVNFLSGGQTLEDAAARLCAINQVSLLLLLL